MSTTPTAVPAESAPAPVQIPTDSAEYKTWRMTGNLPKPQAESAPAPSEPKAEAKPEKAEAKPEAEARPASEAEQAQDKPKGSKAQARILELLQRTKELEAKLAERDPKEQPKDVKQAESSPAKADGAPKKPKVDDFETWDKYEAAKDEYFEALAEYKAEQRFIKAEQERQSREATDRWNAKLAEAKKVYPDLDEVAEPLAKHLLTDKDISPLVNARLMRSDITPHLLYVLGGDAEKMEAFLAKAKSDPLGALDEIHDVEKLIREELSAKQKERDDSGKFTSPAKKETKAPPPGSDVSGKGTPPPDEVKSAVAKDDFAGYKAAANRADLERRKGK